MTRSRFSKMLAEQILILDGATGTQMMKRGMPSGVCPELWTMEHPDALLSVQRAYVAAGSRAVYTFTFGGSRFKLAAYGAGDRTREINAALAAISREAVGPDILVGGDLAPSGRMLLPYGDTAFEDVVDAYKEQVRGLLDGGVDFFVVETMMDLQEARAAVLAVRELCDLPIIATMTFESGMRTLTGTDPVSALIALQALGVDAVGTNCSTGPAEMVAVVQAMRPHARVPLVAKANAGKPKLVDGTTVFDMNAEAYAGYADAFIDAGVAALGGCCGTDPGFIAKLAAAAAGRTPGLPAPLSGTVLSAMRKAVPLGPDFPVCLIGNRMQPELSDGMKEILAGMDVDEAFDLAREQVDDGAGALWLSAAANGVDEASALQEMAQTVAQAAPVPLVLGGSHPDSVAPALRAYAGRAMLCPGSGWNAGQSEAWTALAEKYGAALAIPVSVPGAALSTPEQDIPVAQQQALAHAQSRGLTPLAMLALAGDTEPRQVLRTAGWLMQTHGIASVLDLSELSPDAPAWEQLDAAFYDQARKAGVACLMADPSLPQMRQVVMA